MKKTIIAAICAATMSLTANAAAFTDVKSTDWFSPSVEYAVSNGLFNGTSSTEFSPKASMTRGMFVTVLGRLAKIDKAAYNGSAFDDVQTSAYYAPYVKWASSKGIVSGTGGGKFSPNAPVTREQLAKMLCIYAASIGVDTDEVFTPDKYYDFTDYLSVSRYAANAMSWCVNAGVINGAGGKLNPKGTATRAEVATMLMNAQDALKPNSSSNAGDQNGSSSSDTGKDNTVTQPDKDNTVTQPDTNTGNNKPEEKPDDSTGSGGTNSTTVTDEIDQRPTGKSAVDENGGYWDYDIANATFDTINDLREENGLPRLAYSLKVQEWADIRSKELVGAYRDNLYSAHTRPNGKPFSTIGAGSNTENALGSIISATGEDNCNQWYASPGHRKSMLNTRSKASAVSVYVLGERTYAIELFNIKSVSDIK